VCVGNDFARTRLLTSPCLFVLLSNVKFENRWMDLYEFWHWRSLDLWHISILVKSDNSNGHMTWRPQAWMYISESPTIKKNFPSYYVIKQRYKSRSHRPLTFDYFFLLFRWYKSVSDGPIVHLSEDVWLNMEQRWNYTDRGKEGLGEKLVCATLCNTNPTVWTALGVNRALRYEKSALNRLYRDTARF
jgi:hypothetical protein